MRRHYYISNDLDDLDHIEEELESSGVHKPQIHVFSQDDSSVLAHDHLHNIHSIFKSDIVHGIITGAWIGFALAVLVLVVTSYNDWAASYSWVPFILLALVLLGFFTWLGGLYGFQEPHREFKRFEAQLRSGKHVFIVDVDADQEAVLEKVIKAHPGLVLAGTGKESPRWFVMGQHTIKKITPETFP